MLVQACSGAAAAKSGATAFFEADHWEKLRGVMTFKKIPAGACLFWEGDPAAHLYYLANGSVKLTKTSESGHKVTFYLHHKGDLFGQLDLQLQASQLFNAEVLEDAEVGLIRQEDLEMLMWQHSGLAIAAMNWMAASHRVTQTKFRDLLLYGKHGALCSLLIRLSNSYGVPCEGHIRIERKLNHSELADMIGATRESVNRMLGELRKIDVISIHQKFIIIKDLHYLRGVCKCDNCPATVCRV